MGLCIIEMGYQSILGETIHPLKGDDSFSQNTDKHLWLSHEQVYLEVILN